MRAPELVRALAAFPQRGPGTDSERRAARWLAGELAADRYRVRIEPFWCRPNWALAHAWHVALALAGALISVGDPTIGTVLLAVALVSTVADDVIGLSLGRRLTPERASQNVLATRGSDAPGTAAHLVVTANYDAGRTGLIYRDPLRGTAARLSRLTASRAPGWLAWLSLVIVYELAVAIIRLKDAHPPGVVGAVQLPPTVALVIALALLLEAASAGYGPAAGDNAAGTAVAVALVRALADDPPRNLTVELILQGAGESEGFGLRRHLRARRRELRTEKRAIALGIAACGAGEPAYWISDGRLVPLRFARALRALGKETGATAHRGRGGTPALPARAAGLPAIAIGCLDRRGLAPRSHQRRDDPESIDPDALDRALELSLALARAIDASVATTEDAPTPA